MQQDVFYNDSWDFKTFMLTQCDALATNHYSVFVAFKTPIYIRAHFAQVIAHCFVVVVVGINFY